MDYRQLDTEAAVEVIRVKYGNPETSMTHYAVIVVTGQDSMLSERLAACLLLGGVSRAQIILHSLRTNHSSSFLAFLLSM